MGSPTVAEMVPAYVKLRDTIEEMEKKHKEELAPLKSKLKLLDTWFLGQLEQQGVQSIKTEDGTVFKKQVHSVSVSDWEQTWHWIAEGKRFDFLNHAVNKTAVVEYVEANKEVPPGVNYTAAFTVQVNRARGT